MGLPWDTRIALAETEIPFTPYGGNLDELVTRARQHNPQMNQVRLGLAAREGKIAEARSGHLPVVALFGNVMRLDNSFNNEGMITDENKNSWQIGLSMELPIFNGFRTTREVQEARLRLEKLKHQSLLLQEGVALQVKHAFLQIARSQGQVQTMKEAVQAAAENRELNIRAYAQEMVETKDVIEAQLMEFLMHAQYLKALYDHQVNSGELEYIIGNNIYDTI
jgi:outer membrane protein TolC